jgi:hypothetical protein
MTIQMKVKVKAKGYNGFPAPKKVKCFQCQKGLLIKFVIPRFTYSKKNDWYH